MKNDVVFLVAGERSGDQHAEELLAALEALPRADKLSFHGIGGPNLAKRYGDQFEDWVEEAAVIGFTEVLKKYGWFKKKFAEVLERIFILQPSVVILVDYPGFNLRIAKALRKRGYEGKICYYISPQVWAWNRSRIPKMAQTLDLMLCVFEFEKALYEESGLQTEWVGHPMVEEIEQQRLPIFRENGLVGLLPGSRRREVNSLLPPMLAAGEMVLAERPDVRFELAVPSQKIHDLAVTLMQGSPLYPDHLSISIGTSTRLMQQAETAWVASGTASLEAGYYGLPYALVYKVSALTYMIAKAVIKIPYIGMVNVLADKLVVKELIQSQATPQNLSAEILAILNSAKYRTEITEELEKVKAMLGGGGAHRKAAQAIATCVSNHPQ